MDSLYIICGTNRPNSNSSKLSGIVSALCNELNIDHQEYSVNEHSQFLSQEAIYDRVKLIPELIPIRESLIRTQYFIFVVPEYNGSFAGIFKLWIDAISIHKRNELFGGKKILFVGLGDGQFGNMRGIDHLITIFRYMGSIIFPKTFYLPQCSAQLSSDNHEAEWVVRLKKTLKEFHEF